MRITKEPEERKQEILDTAMRLFYEKGYEKTSIADIAKEIGVAQGLCYRYFPSKEALFDCAIEQYADEIVSKFTISKGNADVPIWEKYTLTIEEASKYFRIGENKLRKLAEENPTAGWVILNGNRIQIKRKQFEKIIDTLDAI